MTRSKIKIKDHVGWKFTRWPISRSIDLLRWYACNQNTNGEFRYSKTISNFFRTDFWNSSFFGVTWPSKLRCYEQSTGENREAWCNVACVCRRHTTVLLCRRDDMASTALQLERCLTDVGHWMSANIDWSWMPTRPSFSGPDPGAVALPWAAVVPSYSSKMIPSFLPTMLKCSEWHCRLIWQWTNTFPTSARPDFIGCGNFDVFGGHSFGHGVGCNPRARLCHVPHRLL